MHFVCVLYVLHKKGGSGCSSIGVARLFATWLRWYCALGCTPLLQRQEGGLLYCVGRQSIRQLGCISIILIALHLSLRTRFRLQRPADMVKPIRKSQHLPCDWFAKETSSCLATRLEEDEWQSRVEVDTEDKDGDWAVTFLLKRVRIPTEPVHVEGFPSWAPAGGCCV